MKALPDFTDVEAMAERGRRSHLGSARNEATEALRDAHSAIQSADWSDLHEAANRAGLAAERLKTLAAIWNEIEQPLEPLLKASIEQAKAKRAAGTNSVN